MGRRLGRLVALATILAGWCLGAVAAEACPGDTPCLLENGDYYALPPPGWDGRTPLPAAIFFHGHGATALDFANDKAFTAAFAKEGVLLILPDSDGPGWDRSRDDLAFAAAMRRDVLARFPVEPDRLLATGFSAGAILALQIACEAGQDYAGFVIIAGAFRLPVPEGCATGPVNVLQIQGLSDEAVPMQGTPPEDSYHLAAVPAGLDFLRRLDGCPANPALSTPGPSGEICEAWGQCSSGRALSFCMHDGGHLMPKGWVHQAETWLRTLAQR